MKYEAVLFDCDGVLVDSEGITNEVLRVMLKERGWSLSSHECMDIFLGRAVKDLQARIEHHTAQPLTQEWMQQFRDRRDQALQAELVAIPNAVQAVQQIHGDYGARIACASGADRGKVELQLNKVGLMTFFEGRIFSGHEVPRSKPHPDVYLAAAAALGLAASACAVVEDTITGARAGLAAGATVLGYCPSGAGYSTAQQLRELGVQQIFTDMAHLPAMLN